MGLDPSLISFEGRTEAIPEVYVRQLKVSEDILRGVLKIGFELYAGYTMRRLSMRKPKLGYEER